MKMRPRFVVYLHLGLVTSSVLWGVSGEPQLAWLGSRLSEAAEVTLILLAGSMVFFFAFPVLYLIAMRTCPGEKFAVPFLGIDIVLSVLQYRVLLACLS